MKGLKDPKTGRFVRNLKDKKCAICGKVFAPRFATRKYCSKRCSEIAVTKDHKRNCIICKKEFSAVSMKTKFCSHKCYGKTVKLLWKITNWKKDKKGYFNLHNWVRKHLGKPKKCDHCGTTTATRYEWANKSGLYKKVLEDWIRLCRKCHIKYDTNVI